MTYPVKLFKVTSLPPTSQIEPNSLYLISNPVVSDYLEIGVSNETGTSIVKIPNKDDIEAIVKNQTSGTNVNEDSFLVDEREYTVAEYIVSIHETKMWMEDSITRMESLINSVETNINEIRTSLNMPIIPLE